MTNPVLRLITLKIGSFFCFFLYSHFLFLTSLGCNKNNIRTTQEWHQGQNIAPQGSNRLSSRYQITRSMPIIFQGYHDSSTRKIN